MKNSCIDDGILDEKKLTFGDGFKFGLGFFMVGLVFYIVCNLIFGGMIGSMRHHR